MVTNLTPTTTPPITPRCNFIFGYGSLICPQSRAVTAPSLPLSHHHPPFPILAHHVERTWSARSGTGTYMGVRFRKGAQCTGVLVEVDDEELRRFDERERGYERVSLDTAHLERVPFLRGEGYGERSHVVLDAGGEVKVWIYVPLRPVLADPSAPIVQSYVDVILRGCLGISEEFARHFLETTHGWGHEDGVVKGEDHHTWVNDRHRPLYVRADDGYSAAMGGVIDALMRDHLRDALERRRCVVNRREFR